MQRLAHIRVKAALALVTVSAASAPRAADADEVEAAPTDEPLGWSYLIDGGALPFVWGAAAVAVGFEFLEPPATPRLFSESEGGLSLKDDTIPNYQVGILAGVGTLVLALPSRRERFYHLKGMLEALATSGAVAQIAKNTVSRHRPSYSPDSTDVDQRRSFFSGHSTLTWVTTTYLGLYLQRNVFSTWRPADQSIAWWEPAPLAALAALSIYVPYTRVRDHKHHLSDVVVGSAVGVSAAVGFYIYQERRFRARQRALRLPESEVEILLVPTADGFAIAGSF